MTWRLALVACVCASCLWAKPYDRDSAVVYANKWQNWNPKRHDGFSNCSKEFGNCCKFVSRCVREGGKLALWDFGDTLLNWLPAILCG